MVQSFDRGERLRLHVLVNAAARVVIGRVRSAVRQHHADGLSDRAHRVGGEHCAAGAAARHHVLFQCEQLFVANPTSLVGGAALSVVHDGDIRALLGPGAEINLAGRAGTWIQRQTERIGAGQRHQRGSAGLVAATDHNHCVSVMGVVTHLNAIGHQIARQQTVAGVWRALGQRVRDRGCADNKTLATACGQCLDQQISDRTHPVVAAMRVGIGAGNGDHRIGVGSFVRIEAGGTHLNPRVFPESAIVVGHWTGSMGKGNRVEGNIDLILCRSLY